MAGMAASNIVGLAIILTAASTLHPGGITEIETSAQAAEALRPLAGPLASTLFALGIVGTGLLAVTVLAGSAAYAIGEALRWPTGLTRKPMKAKAFNGTIMLATVIGAVLNFTPINPIKALVWTAVINGIVAVPVMGDHDVFRHTPGCARAVRRHRGAQMAWMADHRRDGCGCCNDGGGRLRLTCRA